MKVRVRVYLGGCKTDGVGVCLTVFVNGNVRGSESKSESKSKSLSGWL